jgi:putative transposase
MIVMEFVHVINRSVDNKLIALNDDDRFRFVHDLAEFNSAERVDTNHARRRRDRSTAQKNLVRIHAWCLMPNHYHLLVTDAVQDGISMFLKKLNMGYSKYYNDKYHREGALWRGRAKKYDVSDDNYFSHIPYYIHLNPLDLSMPQWRRGVVRNTDVAIEKLRDYRWSSHRDFLGEENFRSILYTDGLKNIFGNHATTEKQIRRLLVDENFILRSKFYE